MSQTLKLFVLLVVIGVIGVACSSDAGKLSEYSDSMNPVLQQHQDIYGRMYDTTDQFETRLLAAARSGSTNEIANVMSEFSETLRVWERQFGDLLLEWTVLDPPEDAQRFHEMVFEMMQIRLNSLLAIISVSNQLSIGLPFDEAAMADAAREGDRSDRLWLQILAEARKLGGVKIIR